MCRRDVYYDRVGGKVIKVEEAPIASCSSTNSVAQDSSSVIIDLRNNEEGIVTTNDEATDDMWVMHGKHSLKFIDKAVIEQGEELNDKHIQVAQYLAKTQFPVTGGPESTLLQGKKRKGSCTVNTVQIIYCDKRRHWITASTKFSKPGKVDIYDTMFRKLDAETRTTVKQLFGLKKVDCINMVAMQCQKGTTDCGLFSIVTMTSLVFGGEDPGTVNCDQSKLRKHPVDCISQGDLSLFPKTSC